MKPKISSFIGIALVILIGAGSFFGCAEIKAYAGSEFSDINRGLTGLVREACDKRAIFSLGEALLKSGSDRIAANAYLGFAATCPNGEGEKYRAAGILFAIADYKPVIAIMTDLIAVRPEIDSYRYLWESSVMWNALKTLWYSTLALVAVLSVALFFIGAFVGHPLLMVPLMVLGLLGVIIWGCENPYEFVLACSFL